MSIPDVQRILDAAAERQRRASIDRPPCEPRHSDIDGRPPVGRPDKLLMALIREHPELMPADLPEKLKANRGRDFILASASD